VRRRVDRTHSWFCKASVALAALALLSACGRSGADWREERPDSAAAPRGADYVRPPQVTGAERAGDNGVVLIGQAEPEVRVRLASPDGGAYGSTADDKGHWSLALPPGADVRLFGLSEDISGRLVQGEGYIAVLPAPGRPAVLLKAGGGASPLAPGAALQLTSIDFDPAGSTVLAGEAKPGTVLRASVDGAAAGETHASPHGHFALVVSGALKPGVHQVQVQGAGVQAQAAVTISPPPTAFAGPPYHGARVDGGWRVDWLTPGGGPQATVVLDPVGAGA
jgi:hypothetical protein